MNNEWHEFEQELKRVRPRGLSDTARDRLLLQLGGPLVLRPWGPSHVGWWVMWLSAAALVLVAVGWGLARARSQAPAAAPVMARQAPPPAVQPAPAASPSLRVVAADSTLVRQEDRGVVVPAADMPMRMMEYEFVDRVEWEHPVEHQHIEVTRPRYGVVLTGLNVD